MKHSSVESLPLVDYKAEENPKNENGSACWVFRVLDLLSSVFARSSPNFILKERFSCVTEDYVLYGAMENPHGSGDVCMFGE